MKALVQELHSMLGQQNKGAAKKNVSSVNNIASSGGGSSTEKRRIAHTSTSNVSGDEFRRPANRKQQKNVVNNNNYNGNNNGNKNSAATGASTSNPFTVLTIEDDEIMSTSGADDESADVNVNPNANDNATNTSARRVVVQKEKQPYVPAVYAMANTKEVIEILKKKDELMKSANGFTVTTVSGGRVSIKARSRALRDQVTAALDEEQLGYVSFPPKDERNFKAVLYGMADFTEEEVKTALEESELEMKPLGVKRLARHDKAKDEKVNTPFFLVLWPPATRMSHLKDLRVLSHVRCGFRAYYPSKRPPQCTKCQREE